ncbi:MAG: excinuclease ABC subunit UvrC, partial [Alkalibacterium sp.]|nr:excinuclease ABC subunit UvrC [Alkalibacterium sp.]
SRDFFNYYMDKGWISIQVFFVRQATLIKREATMFPVIDTPEEELIGFILQYYEDINNQKPKEVYVPQTVDTELLQETLETQVIVPKRGRKKELLDLTGKNSEISLKQKFRLIEMKEQKTTGAIEQLSEVMGLPYIKQIESFDHSNIQGTNPVSAMVSFKDGMPDKNNYRKYKIRTVVGSNEFATTQEVIRRRYSRLLKEKKPMPDLILMDGGKVQVNAAKDVLENEFGLSIPVAGMVKDKKHRTAGLIFGNELEPVVLDPRSQAFHLVQRIQEEVHRFAITFHRNVRGKNSFASKLDDVEGVGPKTRTKVLRHFKSMKRLKEADVEEIAALGIPVKVAERIKDTVQQNNN